MPEKIIIDPDCHRPDVVRHNILTRAHYHLHGLVSFDETRGHRWGNYPDDRFS